MPVRFLLALCLCLLHLPGRGQSITVAGRVLDQMTGEGLPGVSIIQEGTSNGTPTDSDGYFTLTVPLLETVPADSVSLRIAYIGYQSQLHKVAPGTSPVFRLVVDTRLRDCGVATLYPLLEAGLTGGVRYAPYGGTLKLYGHRLLGHGLRLPLSAMASYQTSLHGNNAFTASLVLPPLFEQNRLSLSETLSYQQLRAGPANLYFTSYTATIGFMLYSNRGSRLPTLQLGAGYAQARPYQEAEQATESGYGYSMGASHLLFPEHFRIYAFAQATRWPGYWQLQGRLSHSFRRNFEAGVAVNHLRQYRETSIFISRSFY